MNKGQVCEEIVVLRRWGRGGGNLSTKIYFIYIYIIYIYIYNIYIYIYIYIYFSIAQCRYVEVERDISGPLKKITWTNLFHGASLLQYHLTMVQAKDATKRCNPYLKEKLLITCRHELSLLNKHNKLVSPQKQSITA